MTKRPKIAILVFSAFVGIVVIGLIWLHRSVYPISVKPFQDNDVLTIHVSSHKQLTYLTVFREAFRTNEKGEQLRYYEIDKSLSGRFEGLSLQVDLTRQSSNRYFIVASDGDVSDTLNKMVLQKIEELKTNPASAEFEESILKYDLSYEVSRRHKQYVQIILIERQFVGAEWKARNLWGRY